MAQVDDVVIVEGLGTLGEDRLQLQSMKVEGETPISYGVLISVVQLDLIIDGINPISQKVFAKIWSQQRRCQS